MTDCFCAHSGDRLSRRSLIRAGLGGAGGLSLAEVLRLRAHAAEGRGESSPAPRDTAVIFVLQEGGASQFETYDPKPLSPVEIRGEFSPISTSVPGVHFCDAMPHQARLMHRLTVLRSIHHPSTQHSSSVHLVKTGYYCRPEATENEMPAVGACVSRLRGPNARGVPPYAVLHAAERYDGGHYVGRGFNPFLIRTTNDDMKLEFPRTTLVDGLSDDRWQDRRRLLADLDATRRVLDARGSAEAVDEFRRLAYDMISTPRARQAFDVEAEPAPLRDRYGRNPIGQRMLLARRLVEHGVTFLTVGTFNWDHHGDLWRDMRKHGPMFDQATAALIDDLHDRGLAKRVLVVVMGEFGREPKITAINGLPPGRDHWGNAMSVALAGGGLKGGQVIGATDANGGRPIETPYRAECVLAHVYRHLGIDPSLTFPDFRGRPRHLLEIREPIRELA